MSNSNINVDTKKVSEIASSVSKTYTEMKNSIDAIAKKRDLISSYWSASESEYFVEELKKIDTLFSKFTTQYNVFIDSLNKVVSNYDEQEKKLLDALSKTDDK